MFRSPGSRVKRAAVRSGERSLEPEEIVTLDGLRVTTKLRTTCDLGMQLPRRPAYAAMCAMMKVADFTADDIRVQADTRFKGYRWVTQLRGLAPWVRPEFDSPGECGLGLSWLEEGNLPPFVPQLEVRGPTAGASSTSRCRSSDTPPSTTAHGGTARHRQRTTRSDGITCDARVAGSSTCSATCTSTARRRWRGRCSEPASFAHVNVWVSSLG
jgi:hypothetical protein